MHTDTDIFLHPHFITPNGATADAAQFLYWNIFLFRYRITE